VRLLRLFIQNGLYFCFLLVGQVKLLAEPLQLTRALSVMHPILSLGLRFRFLPCGVLCACCDGTGQKNVVSALSLSLCAILAACSQNSRANNNERNNEDPSNAKPGFLDGLFSSTKPVTVPEGTHLAVVLDETLSSAENRSGDKFQASLVSPVVVDDQTVIPQNSRVFGHVVRTSCLR
jgi:hypothetical protein